MSMLNKEDIIKLFGPNPNKWDWVDIGCKKLSEDFIREFQDKVDWDIISYHQRLSENFIREFEDKVDWGLISHLQTLSEDFIREFKDKVHWGCISLYQELSQEFINEFKDYIYMDIHIIYNIHCSPDIKIKYLKEHNLIKKQDPTTHDFEYFENPIKPVNNDLQLLKELIQC